MTTLATGCRQPRDIPGDPWHSLTGSYLGKCSEGHEWSPSKQMHCKVCHATFGELAVHCPDCHAVFGGEKAFQAHLHGRNHQLALNTRGQWGLAKDMERARALHE